MAINTRTGFTLIELITVVIIVAVLAAVAIPTMTGSIIKAKKSEGMAGIGTIKTALRIYAMENNVTNYPLIPSWGPGMPLYSYVRDTDLQGKYYNAGNYSVTPQGPAGTYTIKAAAPGGTTGITTDINMDQNGTYNGY